MDLSNIADNGSIIDFESFRERFGPTHVAAMIKSALESPSQLGSIAENSYLHDNGFYKLVLQADNSSGSKLRLHLWDTARTKSGDEMNVHNHRWKFYSRILHGIARHYIFSESQDSGESFFKYRYLRDTSRNGYVLSLVGTQQLEITSQGEVQQGQSYMLDSEVLHRVIPCSPYFLTLVLHEGARKESTSVYSLSSDWQEQERPSPLNIELTRVALLKCYQLTAMAIGSDIYNKAEVSTISP